MGRLVWLQHRLRPRDKSQAEVVRRPRAHQRRSRLRGARDPEEVVLPHVPRGERRLDQLVHVVNLLHRLPPRQAEDVHQPHAQQRGPLLHREGHRQPELHRRHVPASGGARPGAAHRRLP